MVCREIQSRLSMAESRQTTVRQRREKLQGFLIVRATIKYGEIKCALGRGSGRTHLLEYQPSKTVWYDQVACPCDEGISDCFVSFRLGKPYATVQKALMSNLCRQRHSIISNRKLKMYCLKREQHLHHYPKLQSAPLAGHVKVDLEAKIARCLISMLFLVYPSANARRLCCAIAWCVWEYQGLFDPKVASLGSAIKFFPSLTGVQFSGTTSAYNETLS